MRWGRLFGWMDREEPPATNPADQPPELDAEQRFLNTADAKRSDPDQQRSADKDVTLH